ncbi:hypothetical protein NBRC116188_25140 [Oceaniserpentilla sp. 4NH20-0058]|uniref:hypothetical protein n=1 Tax=Oceaniserpentilla sp. 4NH20-0058 TaxID=3127660 RepID=UPI0031083F1D
MDKIVGLLLLIILSGCTGPKTKSDNFLFEYTIPPSYPLTDQHKFIYVQLNDTSLELPEEKLEFEALTLKDTSVRKKAHIIVYINLSPSYLVQRQPISRRIVEYDEKEKGHVTYKVTNRGYVRTRYTLEVVDIIQDTLIYQTQGSSNYAISAKPKPEKNQTITQLKSAFYENRIVARETLLAEIWNNIKQHYLQSISVTFASSNYNLLSYHEQEPAFEKAYKLLLKNDKTAARQALNIYDQALKKYSGKDSNDPSDEKKLITTHLNKGITVALDMVNTD